MLHLRPFELRVQDERFVGCWEVSLPELCEEACESAGESLGLSLRMLHLSALSHEYVRRPQLT